jgi:hypothetical protein|tara:strand:- start:31 stop:291 length:261 start_codon:yes stop_codon:yes gene_type:complete
MASSKKISVPHNIVDMDDDLVIHRNGKDYSMFAMYDDINLRLEVISEIIDELIELGPDVREKASVETRVEQKLMMRKLAGKDKNDR